MPKRELGAHALSSAIGARWLEQLCLNFLSITNVNTLATIHTRMVCRVGSDNVSYLRDTENESVEKHALVSPK